MKNNGERIVWGNFNYRKLERFLLKNIEQAG